MHCHLETDACHLPWQKSDRMSTHFPDVQMPSEFARPEKRTDIERLYREIRL